MVNSNVITNDYGFFKFMKLLELIVDMVTNVISNDYGFFKFMKLLEYDM